jgi:hypothetical protein
MAERRTHSRPETVSRRPTVSTWNVDGVRAGQDSTSSQRWARTSRGERIEEYRGKMKAIGRIAGQSRASDLDDLCRAQDGSRIRQPSAFRPGPPSSEGKLGAVMRRESTHDGPVSDQLYFSVTDSILQ